MPFPPICLYPLALDDDHTLYLVFNTTEAQLCADNQPWSQEVSIVPVGKDQLEIWGFNGFANLNGELFYYDSVDTDRYGKVKTLKGCARNLGGTPTAFNPKGSWVRSYVIAEHHNQIVEGILNTENFIGRNFDPRMETLDWRIRNLQALGIIWDDFTCPDVDFTFNIISDNATTGIVAQYSITVTPPGSISSFRLDFGDGQFTTTALSGTHTYSPNAVIDPIVTIGNDQCSVIQTAITRTNPNEPTTTTSSVFEVPIPTVPPVPPFTIVPCTVPLPQNTIPPIVLPCFSLEGSSVSIPSIIMGPTINMVSSVDITGPSINMVSNATITIIGDIPSMIFVDVPPTIVIEPPIPPTIVIIASNAASFAFGVDYAEVPNIQVDWGQPPTMEVSLAFAKQAKNMPISQSHHNEFGAEFADLFDTGEHLKVEYETVGIPSEIKIIAPEFPKLEVDASGMPRTIKVTTEDCNIPTDIFVRTEGSLQSGIIRVDSTIPDQIEVRHNMPETIELVGIEIPKMIEVVMQDKIPDKIWLEMVKPFPEKLLVEGIPDFIRVDMPTSIEVTGFPEFLPVKFPEEMPQIELVYRGAPIEMKLVMDPLNKSQGADGEEKKQCFTLVPC
jgi:hypothetical protein